MELFDAGFISRNWPLTNVFIDSTLQQSGERIVRKVISNQGTFVFKLTASSKTKSQLEKDTHIFPYLQSKSFEAPRLILTTSGEYFVKINDQYVYALTFLDGETPPASKNNYARLGEAVAELHSLEGYELKTEFNPEDVIEEMLEKNEQYVIGKEYEQLLKSLPNFAHLPQRLIHTDIGLHNSIQLESKDMVLIDWDDAGIGARILDLGFPLICTFIKNNNFDEENATAFYEAYAAKVQLTQAEIDVLFDAGLFYILMYSIFDGSGIHHENWRKARYAVANQTRLRGFVASIFA